MHLLKLRRALLTLALSSLPLGWSCQEAPPPVGAPNPSTTAPPTTTSSTTTGPPPTAPPSTTPPSTAPPATPTTTSTSTTLVPPPTSPPTTPPTSPPTAPASSWVVGYYAGYQRDLLPPSEVPWSSLTHLVVTRVVPAGNGALDTSYDVDPVAGPAMAQDLAGRARANGVVPLLMVGGAGTHDGFAAAIAGSRAQLVRNLVAELRRGGFAGLDLDLEPILPQDEAPFEALVDELRAAVPGIVLTVPVGWVSTTFPDVPAFYGRLAGRVDRLGLMSYSMAGAWDGWQSWHSSALFGAGPSYPSSIEANVSAYLQAGVPPGRLALGIGFYGSCWNGVDGPRQDLRGARIVADDNVMSFAAIMGSYYSTSAYRYDAAAEAPYLTFARPTGPQGCTFVSYEDERSVAAKGRYAAAHGLGGAIVWTINQGHRRSAPAGSQDALLAATAAAFR